MERPCGGQGAFVCLGQRPEPARLLVVGTYRPVEVLLRGHPLRGMVQGCVGEGGGRPPAGVAVCRGRGGVCGQAAGGPVMAPLTAFVYARTDGNGCYMVNIVEHLVQQGGGAAGGAVDAAGGAEAQVASLPEGLQALLLRRIEALPPAVCRVLEAASVVGTAFTVAAVAAGSQAPVEDVEVVCEGLAAQQHLLDEAGLGVWPDGTPVGGRYRFRHALY